MAAITRINPGPRMSQGVIHAGVLYSAGQVDATAREVAGQTWAVLAKIDGLLAEAGTTKAHVLSASIWLADIASFDEMNAVWEAWIDPEHPPARATVEAALASPEYRVEIAVLAAVDGF